MPTPRIFVSHSHFDNAICRQIVAELRQRFGEVFYDESELHAGDEWQNRIQQKVVEATVFIVILSPHSLAARWVKTETNLFLNLAMDDPSRILIPVRIDPTVDKAGIMAFVPILILQQMIDMTDARPGVTPARFPDLLRVISGEVTDTPALPPIDTQEAQRLRDARDLARKVREAVAKQQWLVAVTWGKRAVTLPGNEQDESLWGEYSEALLEEGEVSEALAAIEQAIRLNEARPEHWGVKARCLEVQGKVPEAFAAWQEAFYRTGAEAGQLVILGEQYRLALGQEQWATASRLVRLARQLVPQDAVWQTREAEIARQQEEQRREQAERARREQEALQQRVVPVSLQQKGFRAQQINGVTVIVPPVITIAAGPFLMGSDKEKDPQAYDDELPQHTVTLGEYAIGQYPLTVAEYACAVGQTVNGTRIAEPGIWQQQLGRPDHPVVDVSWQDVLQYVQWLAQVTGQPWRMPTEAEWEKAARGTDGRIYPYGNTFDKNKGNTKEGGKGTTTAVGSYPGRASPYGVLDMSGNVWEWCSSESKGYPYNGNDGRENLNSTNNRMLRGGSWGNEARYARATYRDANWLGLRDSFVGARVALGAASFSSLP